MTNRRFHILSMLLAVGAFFLPFLGLPLTRARSEKGTPSSQQAHAAGAPTERALSAEKEEREFDDIRETAQGDAALGIF